MAQTTDNKLVRFFSSYGKELAFVVAFVATLGSLLTSLVIGWQPCTLCWIQRIFMYPLVLILAAMIIKQNNNLWYVLPLTVLGAATAAVHHILIRTMTTRTCGFAVPCVTEHSFYLGSFLVQPMYIPAAAFIAFCLISGLVTVSARF